MSLIKKSSPVLREVLMQFSVEQDIPDRRLLDFYVEKYPQFEHQLKSLASQLMDDSLSTDACEDEKNNIDSHDIEEAALAVSLFQTRFFEETGRIFGQSEEDATTIENRLGSLAKQAYRNLASKLCINTLVLNQLRDREIDAKTIPQRFVQRFACEMHSSVEAILRFLNLPPVISPMASFKANDKPRSETKESFEQALKNSGMSEEQIRSLLD
ncbi:hypothetical protein [Paraburkholderia pallida]|uniref:Uncharacterized protein n=1 Tax=Paraburkholderia pallida TaxID=2547399 RepID=A0A4P7D7A7_9BURK|nr:hypothetical protein [Paraburkholderia pallida]QBR02492.1 hypothetical protein E1956_35205 [Paraburkholderia pallida]